MPEVPQMAHVAVWFCYAPDRVWRVGVDGVQQISVVPTSGAGFVLLHIAIVDDAGADCSLRYFVHPSAIVLEAGEPVMVPVPGATQIVVPGVRPNGRRDNGAREVN